jgi:hypothetical protein
LEENKRLKKVILTFAGGVIAVLLIAGITWYIGDYYHADEAVAGYLREKQKVSVTEIEEGLFFDGPGKEEAMIFYPGAKVEYKSYAPLMQMTAQKGIDCFLVKMPGNLAIFGIDKAEGIFRKYQYEQWYMGGHSLGGAMAASYSSKHMEKVDGVLLLAAYPTKPLKKEGFKVVSVFGSEDEILDRKKLKEGKEYMPKDYSQVCIQGGNHAWFGLYGKQDGDGNAEITHEEQWKQTVDAIKNMRKK